MKKRILLVSVLAAGFTAVYGQRWEPIGQKGSEIRKNVDVKQAYRVDLASLRHLLKDAVETGKGAKPVIVSLPTAEGKIEKFAVYSNPVMEKSLAERHQLGSYVGAGIDDPSKYIRFSTAPTEMESMIIRNGVFQFIEPISADKQTYGVFYKTHEEGGIHGFECDSKEHNLKDIKKLVENGKNQLSNVGIAGRPTNTRYRTFRMAMAVTGEYTQFHGGTAQGALTAVNNTMTRINGVFEKDFGAHFIVQDLPGIIYTDPAADFYIPQAAQGDPSLNLQLQRLLTNEVGDANYDLGHVFHRNVGGSRNGNAGGIGIVCSNPANNNALGKGSAFSMSPDPTGEVFDLMAAHEMGHQLGANHTFSMRTEGSGANVEPWGGTTIMGYPGITQDNIQANMDGYFHYKSISQVLNVLEAKPACGIATLIAENTAPAITPLISYSIPKGTAYYLDANAVDAENDTFSYTWEQYNSVGDRNTISGDSGWGYNAEGALARSLPGTPNGRRYFPKLESVMNGILTDKNAWETVSYIPRELSYAVTVRDQNGQRPMTSTSETTVIIGNDGPFKFNGFTTASVLYNNAANTIYWEVANTNNAPYNVANVKIDYTADNGVTWTDLVASTPNTGSYTAQMPANLNGAVKLRISTLNNIFYAVSPAINVGAAPTSTTNAPTGVSAIGTEILKTTARISWNKVSGATYSVNYRKTGTANWSNTTSQTNSVLLNNLEDETNYEVQVAAVVNTVPGTFSGNYAFKTKGLRTGTDYCLMTTGGNGGSFNSGLVRLTLSNLAYVFTGLDVYKTYLDFSEDAAKLVNLTKGVEYTANFRNLAGGNYNDWLEIWIDYNRNGVFEDSEKVASSSGLPVNPAPGTYLRDGNVTFTVPAAAYAGDKLLRMRVASTFFNAAGGPCGSPTVPVNGGGIVSVGSFRDFSVRISENAALAVKEIKNTPSEIAIYPNPADTYIEVKNLKGKANYKIYSADGRLAQEGKLDGQRINVASLIKGVYVISITSETDTYSTKLIKK
ncbi:reprolysin-like metallopeptidase [Chryseobacterium vrystaatense]|uniref:Por secretion system C-terminal sorting domain-containing protein n=1 Tax=Chryseobacterium vrystaatense TaxID=307480 RepID=A0A1M5NK99_9FLAO|nr:M12 family metallo-peptidase [Chryseobacterium vrystaatense]SHG89865.1 Por secretion system C-terminal sorting domain-containing protein [Chryseobacterium vrystaatense]